MFVIFRFEQDGVEQSDDSEDIKEMIMEEECANAFNDAISTVGEKTDEVRLTIIQWIFDLLFYT